MLQSSLLWYNKFKRDLEGIGFKFNPYNPCVANRIVNNKVLFHIDDLKSSHFDPSVNDDFLDWLNETYGQVKAVTATRGVVHEYLGMRLDYGKTGKIQIDMREYIQVMLQEFPNNLSKGRPAPTPAGPDLFGQSEDNTEPLEPMDRETFHTIVAKGLFLASRGRPDIQPTIAFLCTRVNEPTRNDWIKLRWMMIYLRGTIEIVRTLSKTDLGIVKWHVDTAFAVHPDYKSHSGMTMLMGADEDGGAVATMSRNQKLNTRLSTHAKLVGADDAATMILWTKLFMEHQGIDITSNVLLQDNKSAILLEKNGAKSA
jgi:hypothetical protein